MATAASSSASPSPKYPPGYYRATRTPPVIQFLDPNCNLENEIDFYKYIYLKPHVSGRNDEFVSTEALKNIVMSPISPWEEKLKDMIMVGEAGTVEPTFLPNFIDAKGKGNVSLIFRVLQSPRLAYDGYSEVVPTMYKAIAYSKPEIKFEGPIYEIGGSGQVKVKLVAVSDGVAIFHLDSPKSNCFVVVENSHIVVNDSSTLIYTVLITSEHSNSIPIIPAGSSFLVWNARHDARPSFKVNFNKLVQLNNPIGIVLTEVRMYKRSLKSLLEGMETTIECSIDESVGLTGRVIRWDKTSERLKVG